MGFKLTVRFDTCLGWEPQAQGGAERGGAGGRICAGQLTGVPRRCVERRRRGNMGGCPARRSGTSCKY